MPTVETTFTVALQIVRGVKELADVFPPLKAAAAGVVLIAEFVEEMKKNKEEWRELAAHIKTRTAVLFQLMQDGSKKSADWEESLHHLDITLQTILKEIKQLDEQTRGERVWSHFRSGGKLVQELRGTFDESINLFQFEAAVEAVQLHGASTDKIIAGLSEMFNERIDAVQNHIDAKIDSSAELARLPDPKGTSWDSKLVCHSGTRTKILQEIATWISAATNSPGGTAEIFLVADGVGTGKTALAHTVCQSVPHEQLVASFFFRRSESSQSTPGHLFGSIIRGLARLDRQVENAITQLLSDNKDLATVSPTRQFDEIILKIWDILPTNRPLVIVIDALDEGYDEALLDILCDKVPCLPRTFRFLITSRPEPEIMDYMTTEKKHIRLSLHPFSNDKDLTDIATYIDHELGREPRKTKWGGKVTSESRKEFVKKTEGLFQWAATVLKHIDRSFKPIAELQDVMDSTHKQLGQDAGAEKKLDELYAQILSKLRWEDKKFAEAYKAVMGAVVTLKEPLSPSGLSSLYNAKDADDVVDVCSFMQSFLTGFNKEDLDQPIRLLHLSIRDYLIMRAEAPYRLSMDEHHGVLARHCLQTIDKELIEGGNELIKGDTPQLGCSQDPSGEKGSASEQLWLSCRFFGDHIQPIQSESVSPSLVQMMNDIIFGRLMQLLKKVLPIGEVTELDTARKKPDLNTSGPPEEASRHHPVIMESMTYCLPPIHGSLWAIECYEEAIITIKYLVEIDRQLSSKQPGNFTHRLAASLHSLSKCLYYLKRRPDAVKPLQDTVEIYRRLAEHEPDTYEMLLGQSLSDLATCLAQAPERQLDALKAGEESVAILRRLAPQLPRAEFVLGHLLNVLSRCLAALGRPADALEAIEESVQIRRRLASTLEPHAKLKLSISLDNLAQCLAGVGRPADALEAIEEGVGILRRLAADQVVGSEAPLADALGTLSECLAALGRHADV